MSGGSWNYVYHHINEAAHGLMQERSPQRVRLGKLMHLMSKAMHDIEWVDSCDYGPGDETESIEKVFSFLKDEASE